MNINRPLNFLNEHKDQVIQLFTTYQMIEMMLFLKLHLPGISEVEDRDDYLEDINKKINSKTFGKLKMTYLKKYPNDEHKLVFDMETVATQRNSFMHSFCMILSLWENEKEMNTLGKILLDDFTKQSNILFDKVIKMPQ